MPPVNAGALVVAYATVTVDSLTNANNEPWSPEANTGLTDVDAVAIVGYTSGTTYAVSWNPDAEQFEFAALADGTDPGADTDVGELTIRVEGRR